MHESNTVIPVCIHTVYVCTLNHLIILEPLVTGTRARVETFVLFNKNHPPKNTPQILHFSALD